MAEIDQKNPELDRYTIKAIIEHLASVKSPITYGDLAKKVGDMREEPMAADGFAHALGRIQHYCWHLQMPTLPALVINQATRKPGDKFISCYCENHPDAVMLDEDAVVEAAQKACMAWGNWQELYDYAGLSEEAPKMHS